MVARRWHFSLSSSWCHEVCGYSRPAYHAVTDTSLSHFLANHKRPASWFVFWAAVKVSHLSLWFAVAVVVALSRSLKKYVIKELWRKWGAHKLLQQKRNRLGAAPTGHQQLNRTTSHCLPQILRQRAFVVNIKRSCVRRLNYVSGPPYRFVKEWY